MRLAPGLLKKLKSRYLFFSVPADSETLQLVQQVCPHLVREFGPDNLRVCCSKGQLLDFLREFKLPEAVLVRMGSVVVVAARAGQCWNLNMS